MPCALLVQVNALGAGLLLGSALVIILPEGVFQKCKSYCTVLEHAAR
jgi:hypothetical protein